MARVKQNDQGSIIVITVFVLIGLLGFGALATDLAVLYAEKSHLQNAVDASALAGAQELPDSPQRAYQTAVDYSSANNSPLPSVEILNQNKEIKVAAHKEVSLYLARFLGIRTSTVSAEARAAVLSARSLTGVAPLSVTMQDFVFGEEYTLKNAPPQGENGWYGPVRLDGQGASTYEEALTHGNSTPLAIGQVLEIESGNMSGPTKRGLENRLLSDTRVPGNTFEDHNSDAPQIMYIPIVEVVSQENSQVKSVKILGFAAFFIENVTSTGNDCFITGRYLETIVSLGRETSPLNPAEEDPANDYGLYSVKLLMN